MLESLVHFVVGGSQSEVLEDPAHRIHRVSEPARLRVRLVLPVQEAVSYVRQDSGLRKHILEAVSVLKVVHAEGQVLLLGVSIPVHLYFVPVDEDSGLLGRVLTVVEKAQDWPVVEVLSFRLWLAAHFGALNQVLRQHPLLDI